MNANSHRWSVTILLVLGMFLCPGCSSLQGEGNLAIQAVEEMQALLNLPNLPVEYVGEVHMANSPSGELRVASYLDTEGRIFFVHPDLFEVLEIDGRSALEPLADGALLSMDELRAMAEECFRVTTPEFEELQAGLSYEAGTKDGHVFFSWYGDPSPGMMNRPFFQIGLTETGSIFAYYNTLMIK